MSDPERLPAQPAAELRPGVFRPDWSLVTRPKARETLRRRLGARPEGVARWAGLDPDDDLAWQAVLRLFVAEGRPPHLDELARAINCSPERARRALQVLHERDLVMLDKAAAVVAAYPFTRDRTEQHVTIWKRTLPALCAIDALGAGAMCGAKSTIRADCPSCHAPIHIETGGEGKQLRSVKPAGTMVWYTLVFDRCAAQSCCPTTLFFCDEAHLARWLATGRSGGDGDRLTLLEAFEIGVALFMPLLRGNTQTAKSAISTPSRRIARTGAAMP